MNLQQNDKIDDFKIFICKVELNQEAHNHNLESLFNTEKKWGADFLTVKKYAKNLNSITI